MNLLEELNWRGLLQDHSAGLEEILDQQKIVAYVGFDPTAASLTIGNLVSIMLLKHLQLHGHRPIVLLGGATGKIGDPSGKDQERQLLSYDALNKNIEAFKSQFLRLLEEDGPNGVIFLNNEDFYKDMDVFTFLRDIGKNITVNYMMAKDSVKNRIHNREQGISFTEFSYQLIQGYDFEYLYKNYDCVLQMGGSDQWGNILTGTHFVNKKGGKAFGLTCPLLTKSDGSKFGKSEGGNIWLDPKMTSPFQFYQFWLNKVPDADIEKMFKTFSLRTKDDIAKLMQSYLVDNPNYLLNLLADELTTRIHGAAVCESVQKVIKIVFNKNLERDTLEQLSLEELNMLKAELPVFEFDTEVLEQGIQLDELLLNAHQSLDSKAKIRNSIKGNALSINTIKVKSHDQILSKSDLIKGSFIFVQNGKKNKFLGCLSA